ncbi:alpha/beta hydrolase [Synechococcus sp. KORDI-52]|nr:alpha/beta hydrolase [Synechococcus sp. KORDI-52]
MHGFGAASGHWRHCGPQLAAQGWRVYSLDLLGFGQSAQPARPMDNRLWGQQVCTFLDQVVQGPAVVIGNSLGGLTALTAAVLAPERVQAVVAAPLPDPALIQPLPKRRAPWRRRWQRRLLWVVLHLLPLELVVPLIARTGLLKAGLQGAYCRSIQSDQELLQLMARPARRPTAAQALRGMSLGMALRPRGATAPALLEQLRAPMLLIWGREDRFVPLGIGESVAATHPQLELRVLEHCGHCPHDEATDCFLAVVLPWLDRNLGGPDRQGTTSGDETHPFGGG